MWQSEKHQVLHYILLSNIRDEYFNETSADYFIFCYVDSESANCNFGINNIADPTGWVKQNEAGMLYWKADAIWQYCQSHAHLSLSHTHTHTRTHTSLNIILIHSSLTLSFFYIHFETLPFSFQDSFYFSLLSISKIFSQLLFFFFLCFQLLPFIFLFFLSLSFSNSLSSFIFVFPFIFASPYPPVFFSLLNFFLIFLSFLVRRLPFVFIFMHPANIQRQPPLPPLTTLFSGFVISLYSLFSFLDFFKGY